MDDGEVEHGKSENEGIVASSADRHDANDLEQGQRRASRGDKKRSPVTGVKKVSFAQVVIEQRTVRGLRIEEAIGDVDEPGSDAEDRDCRDVCVKLS